MENQYYVNALTLSRDRLRDCGNIRTDEAPTVVHGLTFLIEFLEQTGLDTGDLLQHAGAIRDLILQIQGAGAPYQQEEVVGAQHQQVGGPAVENFQGMLGNPLQNQQNQGVGVGAGLGRGVLMGMEGDPLPLGAPPTDRDPQGLGHLRRLANLSVLWKVLYPKMRENPRHPIITRIPGVEVGNMLYTEPPQEVVNAYLGGLRDPKAEWWCYVTMNKGYGDRVDEQGTGWKIIGGNSIVNDDDGTALGKRRRLTYYLTNADTEWRMDLFSFNFAENHSVDTLPEHLNVVVAKVWRKTSGIR